MIDVFWSWFLYKNNVFFFLYSSISYIVCFPFRNSGSISNADKVGKFYYHFLGGLSRSFFSLRTAKFLFWIRSFLCLTFNRSNFSRRVWSASLFALWLRSFLSLRQICFSRLSVSFYFQASNKHLSFAVLEWYSYERNWFSSCTTAVNKWLSALTSCCIEQSQISCLLKFIHFKNNGWLL